MKKIRTNEQRIFHKLLYRVYMTFGILFFAFLAFALTHLEKLEQFDQQISDFIYQGMNYHTQDPAVSIIAIDKKTVNALGTPNSWSRTQTAEIIDLLNSSGYAPKAIGIGVDYSNTKDADGDTFLAEVCRQYDNICFSAYVTTEVSPFIPQAPLSPQKNIHEETLLTPLENIREEALLLPDSASDVPASVTSVSLPYDELLPFVTTGVINNLQIAPDGFTRSAVTSIIYDNTEYDSFAVAIYKMYANSLGERIQMPKVDAHNSFTFSYLSKSKEYHVYSFYDVITGNIDLSVFEDRIVLIGDYTTSNTTFKVPHQRATQMQYIEVQANIIESLLSQKTGQAISYSASFVFYALFAVIFFMATSYSSGSKTFLAGVLLIILQIMLCAILYLFGYYVLILIPIILVVLITIFNLLIKYLATKHNNYHLEHAFKKYVDKNIVNEIVENGSIDIHIGGEKKDIAVLFVDIRGYTSLSENMDPEQIVDILNKYLTLAANAVALNNGTLDKFIGDAAMAVFNSPNDLADYEYSAIRAAWDLLSNATELNDFCQKEFGKQVSFGIGIHCGEAVIGNIGSEARMDFTAIGDTVNTASRLEGIASPGQIVISAEMKKRLGNRIQTTYAGEFSLKGKKKKVSAYILTGINAYDQHKMLPDTTPTSTDIESGKLYCIPSLEQLEDYANFSREYNAAFEYNDFFLPEILDNEEKKQQIIEQYMRLDHDRSLDTLHGAFLDICVNSSDPRILAASNLRVHQSMDIAKKMGLKAVIFHTNYIVNFRLQSYLNDWLNRNEAYWRQILDEYPDQQIYLENMFDDTPELLTALAARMKDEPRFSVCLDIAHAFVSGSPLSGWFNSLTPYVAHLHINDNNRYEDLHRPVGAGDFPWDAFNNWITPLKDKPSVLIEVRSFDDLQKSVNFMMEHGIYPFHPIH